MGLETKLSLKQTQKLVMTQALQQAIKLLPMARLELVQAIRQELTENPHVGRGGACRGWCDAG